MMGPIFRFVSFHFPYGVVLTGNRGRVLYTLHTAHTKLVRTPLGHFPYLVGILWEPLMLDLLKLVTVTAALCKA